MACDHCPGLLLQDGSKVIREGETINIFSVASGHLYVRLENYSSTRYAFLWTLRIDNDKYSSTQIKSNQFKSHVYEGS